MTPSFEAFTSTADTLRKLESPQPMLQHGSMASDGRLITQDLSQITKNSALQGARSLGEVVARTLDSQLAGQTQASNLQQGTSPKHSKSDKAQLTLALSQTCVLLKLYGKTQAELGTMVEGLCWAIPDFPMGLIIDAMALHVRRKSELPTPADLLAIINPPKPKFRPNNAVYVGIKQRMKDPYAFITDAERDYVWQCEQFAIRGNPDEIDAYEEGQRLQAKYLEQEESA